jgi:hypothetical protein
MLTYYIVAIGLFLLVSFRILDKLRSIQRTQLLHSELLQRLAVLTGDHLSTRKLFQIAGQPPGILTPDMITPYAGILSEPQNLRYQKWLQGKEHEPFTVEEMQALESQLNH